MSITFVHEWKDESRERAESQTFWNEFLSIFGIKRRQVAVFEKAVKKNNQNTGAIDLFWRGVLLVEHKSRGQNFDKAASQAFEYLENLPENDLPEYVLISDFSKFRLFNLETGEGLEELQKAIVEPFSLQEIDNTGFLISDARHNDLLLRAKSEIETSLNLIDEKMSEEIILIGLHNALRFLGQITGETTTEDMLARIFSTFASESKKQ